jgi:hypothetical protein
MPGDVPFLERLAQLPAVPVGDAVGLVDDLAEPGPIPSSVRCSAPTTRATPS